MLLWAVSDLFSSSNANLRRFSREDKETALRQVVLFAWPINTTEKTVPKLLGLRFRIRIVAMITFYSFKNKYSATLNSF